MAKYRKKPVTIEAKQLTEVTHVHTLEGTMQGNPGDWLIVGVNGEMYPCKDEIFRKTYEPVGNEQGASMTVEFEYEGKLYKGILREEQAHGRQTENEYTEGYAPQGE